MELGTVTGRRIGKNRDGDKDRIILQIEIITDEDVRTVELFTQHGDDTNPANGCRVCVIPIFGSYDIAVGVSDGLTPEVDPGEREIYSTDNPVTEKKARLKLATNGDTIINQGTDSAVKYSELNSILQQLVSDCNALYLTAADGGVKSGGLTIDLSSAESETVKIP